MALTKIETAFKTLDSLAYSKEWDTSGSCIKLREFWRDENGEVVREVTHDFGVDTAPPAEPEQVAEPGADVAVGLQGTEATGKGAAL